MKQPTDNDDVVNFTYLDAALLGIRVQIRYLEGLERGLLGPAKFGKPAKSTKSAKARKIANKPAPPVKASRVRTAAQRKAMSVAQKRSWDRRRKVSAA